MDIHDYKKRLEKVEKGIRNSNIVRKIRKLYSNTKNKCSRKFSLPRIERYIYIIGRISERLDKDLDCLEKEDIEGSLEWIQRKDITDWTKYTYKLVFKTFLKELGKDNLASQVILKTVRNKIPDIFTKMRY